MNRPEIRELECFLAVAEELSFTKAARRLNLTQPPLTRQIQSLEEKLGSPLFTRNTRNVSLTEAGALFLEDARRLLSDMDRAIDSVRRVRVGERQRLRLGIVGALLGEEMVMILQRFRAKSQSCQIQLSDLAPAEQIEQILGGGLDGGFVGAKPFPLSKGLRTLVWKREPLVLVFPKGHPLAKREQGTLAALRNETWVTVTRLAAPAFRKQFETICRRSGFEPAIVHETDRAAAVLTMVAVGQGVSLLPASFAKFLPRGVEYQRLSSKAPPVLEHAFVFRPQSRTPELKLLLEVMREYGASASDEKV